MFCNKTFLNPGNSAVIEYTPGGSDGPKYSPFSSVTMVRSNPVAVCVSVTEAPGISAPVGSQTVPKIVPPTAWPNAGCGNKHRIRTRETIKQTKLIPL